MLLIILPSEESCCPTNTERKISVWSTEYSGSETDRLWNLSSGVVGCFEAKEKQ